MSFCIFELKTLSEGRFQVKLKIPRNHRLHVSKCPKYLLCQKNHFGLCRHSCRAHVRTELIPQEHGNRPGGWVGEVMHWKMPPDQVRMSCVLLDNSPIWALIFPICKMEVMNYIGCLQTFSVKNQRVSILGSAGQKVSIESAHLCCYFNTQINGLSYLLTDAETVKYPRTVFTSFFQLFKSVKIILGSWAV